MGSRLLQHEHAKLLATEPATTPGMKGSDSLRRQVGKVLADLVLVQKEVGAVGLLVPSLLAPPVCRAGHGQHRCEFAAFPRPWPPPLLRV